MANEDKNSKAVVMKPPSGPLAIRQRGKIKKPPKTALEEEEFTGVGSTPSCQVPIIHSISTYR